MFWSAAWPVCHRDRPTIGASWKPARGGFTLLELLIVLVILTAIGAVAWPRITGRMRVIAPREAAFALGADLADAREQAIRSGEAWTVRIERHRQHYEWGPVSAFQERERRSGEVLPGLPKLSGTGTQLPQTPEPPARAPKRDVPATSRRPNEGLATLSAEVVPDDRVILQGVLPPDIVFEDGHANQAYDANRLAAPGNGDSLPLRQTVTSQIATNAPQSGQTPVTSGFVTDGSLAAPQPPASQWKYAVVFQPDGRATQAEIRLKDQTSHYQIRVRIRGLTGGISFGDVERPQPRRPEDGTQPPLTPHEAAPPTTLPGNRVEPRSVVGQEPLQPAGREVSPSQ